MTDDRNVVITASREETMARKRARWGSGGYTKSKDHAECPHPVKGSHDPKVEQCCMCGKQTAVKEAAS